MNLVRAVSEGRNERPKLISQVVSRKGGGRNSTTVQDTRSPGAPAVQSQLAGHLKRGMKDGWSCHGVRSFSPASTRR